MEISILIVFLLLPVSRSTFDFGFSKIIYAAEAVEIKGTEPPQRPESVGRFLWPFGFFKSEDEDPPRLVNNERRGCGGVWDQPSAMKIMGGTESVPLSWPWMGLLLIIRRPTVTAACGCTLISRNHAITAGHCVRSPSGKEVDKENVKVVFGIHNIREDKGKLFHVLKIRIHPKFDYHYNDVAFRDIDGDVTSLMNREEIMPVCVPTPSMVKEDFVGETGTVIGWGKLGMGGPSSDVLRQVDIPVISNTDCGHIYSTLPIFGRKFPYGFTDSFLCTIDPNGGKDACQVAWHSYI